MALETLHFMAMRDYMPRGKLLCLGYPDLLVPAAILSPKSPVREDGEAIARWHGWSGPIFDTTSVLQENGWEPYYVDVSPSRNEEHYVDLNQPLLPGYHDAFDGVCDPGTLEHCFNIGEAFTNICRALRVGGVVCHVNPVTMTNHGFFNICPTAFADFYEANGFEIKVLKVLNGPVAARKVEDILEARHKRFALASECSLLTVAQKIKDVSLTWPTQTKYKINPKLKA